MPPRVWADVTGLSGQLFYSTIDRDDQRGGWTFEGTSQALTSSGKSNPRSLSTDLLSRTTKSTIFSWFFPSIEPPTRRVIGQCHQNVAKSVLARCHKGSAAHCAQTQIKTYAGSRSLAAYILQNARDKEAPDKPMDSEKPHE